MDLILCNMKPSLAVQARLTEQLVAGTSQDLVFETAETYSYTIAGGLSNVNQIITNVGEKINYVVFTFLPTPFTNTQAVSKAASYFPTAASTAVGDLSNNPFSQCYMQIGSVMIPQIYYGTLPEDNVRIYQAYLDICNRIYEDNSSAPVLSYNDFFGATDQANLYGGLAMVCFDCRMLESEQSSGSQQITFNATLKTTLDNAVPFSLYATVFTERKCTISAVDRALTITRK
jgi:hypothetical protein